MPNFEFLKAETEYELFADAAIESERVFAASPAMCAIGCRKALELAVKWVYSADETMDMPYKDNLQSLVHEPTFKFAVDINTWGKLPYIIKLGNLAVHTERSISSSDAVASLESLFEFIQWLDYCYGKNYLQRTFDEKLIPQDKLTVDSKKIKEQESLIESKDAEIAALLNKISSMSAGYTANKKQNKDSRKFNSKDLSEFLTRKKYIDVDMKQMGWNFEGSSADVVEEYEVNDMMAIPGQKGFVDYVLFGKDGLPLAVVEAKRTSKDPNVGKKQAMLYADCLERKFGRRPMIFITNGFETYYWDDLSGPQRKVSGIFSREGLQRLFDRRNAKQDLLQIPIDDTITDRYYQKEAIRAVCENIQKGFMKNLLVMATGTGKTRTASSLVDVLSRGNCVTNVLFLADRTALVKQAKDDFKNYLPDMSLCNLCTNKDDRSARIIFSTYPTMLNAIDNEKNSTGDKLFTPEHFDLIIIDESHRSIFKKYRAIFEYFDAILVGLTATPKTDVDRNTYDFFELEPGVPTYAYDYDTAVYKDHVLVPYYNYEVKTKFLEEGITYDDLPDEDKDKYEEDFTEDGEMPDFISSQELNRFVFNQDTVDKVLQDLMERGIKVSSGEKVGKSIIFAQNKRHADYIIKRFNALYPKYNGVFAQRVICDDAYAQTVIDDFKNPEKMPQIAVSVDMMDTGIDVPECVNLVFFKTVKSKTKFWQMIGRGTRLAPNLECIDQVDGEYVSKRRFLIFDYCGNFEFFRQNPNGFETVDTVTLSESIFIKKIKLISLMQDSAFADSTYQEWRNTLVDECYNLISNLNKDLISVHLELKYVEKFKNKDLFVCISDGDKGELIKHIAPLVKIEDNDELTLRFDNFIYGMIISCLEGLSSFGRAKNQLKRTAFELEKVSSVPQVRAKLPLIKQINTDLYWKSNDIRVYENTRKELRDLIQFLDPETRRIIYTNLEDTIIEDNQNIPIDAPYDFQDYRLKVSRFVYEHGDTMAIYKLTHNMPMSAGDFNELERILTAELGSREDYVREFGETPFGLLIRQIAKLDHEAAMSAFSDFINTQSLNQRQIDFVNKIITYIENNGYMENATELTKPPFDRPASFMNLFDRKQRETIINTINSIKEMAIKAFG